MSSNSDCGSAAHTYRPPYAVTCWVDDTHVCIEIPSKDRTQPPYIQQWPLTESGLGRALAIMKQGYKAYKDSGRVFTPTSRQPTRLTRPRTTQEMQERARAVLRKAGIVI